MKKYAIILLVLVAIGVGLTLQLATQEKGLDQTVFLQTTESIRNLQTLDKNLQVLLTQSHLNTDSNSEQLIELNYQISEEFDNLRYDALFEEIESDAALSTAIEEFEAEFIRRDETLQNYLEQNQSAALSLSKLRDLNAILQQDRTLMSAPAIGMVLAHNQNQLLDLALNNAPNAPLDLKPISVVHGAVTQQASLVAYSKEIKAFADRLAISRTAYTKLIGMDISALLNHIEDRYVSYHNQAIAGSNTQRNGLIAYGLVLLLALMFFAWQIRRNYASLEQQVADRTMEISAAYDELRESQEQLIQSEKMASLGQMVAGVAHEINTPLGYVNSNIETLKLNLKDLDRVMATLTSLITAVQRPQRDNRQISQRLLATMGDYTAVDAPELMEESQRLLNDGLYGLAEISNLISSLKDFARLDRQQVEHVDLNACLANALTIASNPIREHNVQVERRFAKLPAISCIPSKLNQLFLNIITNACQAMRESGGTLTIRTSLIGREICIAFTDQGVGMDELTQKKMFDPFFTSKAIGEGTGLGMSIAYKIVEAHNARITVESKQHKGTTISIFFPTALSQATS
ncbi:sensor histidine kinase [Arenicella xantha]|uniref:histidine kinase n=1 Tax=Arenicella xantha TaxID=644221 RepID=A0A395JL68_9GAMM|nr:ATP-binding protein [Arenicella xantha]RBP51451.1 phospho-acceptor domain-containing protein [Arenicella xantha]